MGHAWRVRVWCLGVLLLLLSVLTAFVGYVLPWGQMSFWGATVITSLASALPVVGQSLVSWLWGGLSVENATLNRVLSLHYLLPFIIAGNSVVHLAALHQYGSNHAPAPHCHAGREHGYAQTRCTRSSRLLLRPFRLGAE